MPVAMFGLSEWPTATPVQLHYSADDPYRNQEWVAGYLDEVRASGSELETYLDYPIAGHLFTDASLPGEYDEASASLLFSRSLEFLQKVSSGLQ
jgi:dienelactone hydrolase